jgi:prolyl oligopeptidase
MPVPTVDTSANDDPFIWLEEVDGARVRAFVAARNAETTQALCDSRFEQDRSALLEILNSPDRIPWIAQRGGHVYNFWRDEKNPRGLWRRSTLASYRTAAPSWEIMLDIDALAKAEGEDWVWEGCTSLPPEHRYGLVQLSRGGSDAVVVREFDLTAKRFVEGGFFLPEAKGGASWIDHGTLLVSSALGGEAFQTTSGYARTVRRWRRGTPFDQAQIVFECERSEMVAWGWREHSPRYPRTCFMRRPDFFQTVLYVEDGSGTPRQVDIPTDAVVSIERNWLAVNLRTDWEVAGRSFKAGTLLVTDIDALISGRRDFTVLFGPTPTCFLETFAAAGNVIALKLLDNVQSRILFARHHDGAWRSEPLRGLPGLETVDFYRLVEDDMDWLEAQEHNGETFVISSNSTITPPTLWLARPGEDALPIKQSPARFDATGLTISQHHAASVDGQRIPYFQIARADMPLDGANLCLLTGYGGFQIAMLPHYAAHLGKLWLAQGGVLVIANIRGGGEFGPDWHKAGMRAGKKLSHDDFAAVARDLIARGVTRPQRLACQGGSNGGLLVGNMLTRYPDLFGAIDCAVPLLDMKRYAKLSAGPSWISEYGDPDKPEDWAFLREISAYHQVEPSRRYPPILLTTSGRDDRVHPGHARKMAAKLAALGHTVYLYEPPEGGHAGAADNAQLAFNLALSFAFLRKTIDAYQKVA